MGSRKSSRSMAIRLIRACPELDSGLTPRRCCPITTPSSCAGGIQRRRHPGQCPGHIDVLGNFRLNHRYINDFSSTLLPPAGQLGSAVGAVLHHVLYPLGGCHAGAGKALGPRLEGPFGLGRFTTRFGLQACHSAGAQGFGLAFQLGNPFLQALNDRLLSDDDRNENLAAGLFRSIPASMPTI